VGAQVSAGVSTDLKLAVGLPEELAALTGVPVHGSAGAEGKANVNLLLGPFEWSLRAPQVAHNAAGHDHVRWRLDGGEFVEEQDPGLRVVLRVPHGVDTMKIEGYLEARRYYRLLQSRLKQAIRDLPAKIRAFFDDEGTKIRHHGEWDLTEAM
jgi:hypothetical protein